MRQARAAATGCVQERRQEAARGLVGRPVLPGQQAIAPHVSTGLECPIDALQVRGANCSDRQLVAVQAEARALEDATKVERASAALSPRIAHLMARACSKPSLSSPYRSTTG